MSKSKRQQAWTCIICGTALNPQTDWDSSKNKMYVKCQRCRDKELITPIRPDPRILNILRAPEKRCERCGEILSPDERGSKLCLDCRHADYVRSKRANDNTFEWLKEQCRGCVWAQFQGDFYSCLSVSGTGPDTQTCLKYAIKT